MMLAIVICTFVALGFAAGMWTERVRALWCYDPGADHD